MDSLSILPREFMYTAFWQIPIKKKPRFFTLYNCPFMKQLYLVKNVIVFNYAKE